jgi:hypothetical protein
VLKVSAEYVDGYTTFAAREPVGVSVAGKRV